MHRIFSEPSSVAKSERARVGKITCKSTSKNDEPLRDEDEGTYRVGEGTTHESGLLSRRPLRVKHLTTMVELGWKENVMIEQVAEQ